ncbi:MAG: NAD(P)-dependent alcohol dehydrogenase [Leptospiraceae bacterium]|nr:NAD(P)-dependent alcohol dehydrogenase [Leptospiraceae bacterium]MDW8306702.1 NAD(P)-dependent alcohol dehydrogenase [Leptospiraceae bacterium]
MKAWIIPQWGLENLRIETRQDPKPGSGEILIKMKAVSLNYRDLLIVEGKYNPRMKLPFIPLSDGVGEIVAIGEGVERFRLGQRVCPIFAPRWLAGPPSVAELRHSLGGPLDGTLCEYMVLPETAVVEPPEHLSDEEAATLACAGVTAFSALFVYGKVKAGDVVVVLGTGGVSVFALQFAKIAGATVIITSSSDEKLRKMKELGADYTINYREKPEWSKEVRRITENRGADYVVEVGGSATLKESLKAIRMDGTIALIGILSGSSGEVNLLPVLMQNIRIQGILVGSRHTFEEMNRAISVSHLRPLIDKVFAFEEFPEALIYLRDQKHTGKVVLRISG